jgi:hypothetical protein
MTARDPRDRLGRWLPRDSTSPTGACLDAEKSAIDRSASVTLPRKPRRRIDVTAAGDRVYITTPDRDGSIDAHSVGFTHDEARRVAEQMLALVQAGEGRHV